MTNKADVWSDEFKKAHSGKDEPENETETKTLFCCRCEEFQTFKKVEGINYKCEVCGHITDEFQAESDYDTQIEELDIF
jgi:hypothetical protein